MNIVPMVTAGYKRVAELEIQVLELRKDENMKHHAAAREQGDASENSALDYSRDAFEALEAQSIPFRNALAMKTYRVGASKDFIDFGATVTLECDGNTCTYTMVGVEADYDNHTLSLESGLGGLLAGKKVGDSIQFPNSTLNTSMRIVRGHLAARSGSEKSSLKIVDIQYNELSHLHDAHIQRLLQEIDELKSRNNLSSQS